MTTEGLAYQVPPHGQQSPAGPSLGSMLLAAVMLITGGICLWIAENYKPTLSNELGLNGNSHGLTPSSYHAVLIAGIIFLAAGVLRLLTALAR